MDGVPNYFIYRSTNFVNNPFTRFLNLIPSFLKNFFLKCWAFKIFKTYKAQFGQKLQF